LETTVRNWHWQQQAFVLIMGAMAAFWQVMLAVALVEEWKSGRRHLAAAAAAVDVLAWGWFVLSMVLTCRSQLTRCALEWGTAGGAAGRPPWRVLIDRDQGCRAWRNLRICVSVVLGGFLAFAYGATLLSVRREWSKGDWLWALGFPAAMLAIFAWSVVSLRRQLRQIRRQIRHLERHSNPTPTAPSNCDDAFM
jgi:Na+/H+ antiporter NhaC